MPQGASGKEIITKLLARASELGIPVLLNTRATDLILTDGAVTGVKAESPDTSYVLGAKSVVMATGGWRQCRHARLLCPDLAEISLTTNNTGATGDGMMAQAIGATSSTWKRSSFIPSATP